MKDVYIVSVVKKIISKNKIEFKILLKNSDEIFTEPFIYSNKFLSTGDKMFSYVDDENTIKKPKPIPNTIASTTKKYTQKLFFRCIFISNINLSKCVILNYMSQIFLYDIKHIIPQLKTK